jgi:hypothetical protein
MDRANLDDVLVKAYEEFNTPVDKFLGDSGLIEAFVATVGVRAGSDDFESQDHAAPNQPEEKRSPT